MDFQWDSPKGSYSTYTVSHDGQDWVVQCTGSGVGRRFTLYDGDLNLVYELPTEGGLYLALDFAQGIITKEIPESLASASNL
jgi:hypothetical protein